MVDYDPYNGDFTGTSVHENVIFGGFATDKPDDNQLGNNFENAVITYVTPPFTVITDETPRSGSG